MLTALPSSAPDWNPEEATRHFLTSDKAFYQKREFCLSSISYCHSVYVGLHHFGLDSQPDPLVSATTVIDQSVRPIKMYLTRKIEAAYKIFSIRLARRERAFRMA